MKPLKMFCISVFLWRGDAWTHPFYPILSYPIQGIR